MKKKKLDDGGESDIEKDPVKSLQKKDDTTKTGNLRSSLIFFYNKKLKQTVFLLARM